MLILYELKFASSSVLLDNKKAVGSYPSRTDAVRSFLQVMEPQSVSCLSFEAYAALRDHRVLVNGADLYLDGIRGLPSAYF